MFSPSWIFKSLELTDVGQPMKGVGRVIVLVTILDLCMVSLLLGAETEQVGRLQGVVYFQGTVPTTKVKKIRTR